MPTLEALKGQVMELSAADRAELAAFLAEVTHPAEPPALDDDFRAELDRRLADLKSGAVAGIAIEDVIARLRGQAS